MEVPKNKSSAPASTIRWMARVLCVLAVAFISLFALDVFSEGVGLGQKIVAFLLHMIPSFALIIFLIIAWKHELVGGILITLIGLVGSMGVYSLNYGRSHSISIGLRAAAMIGVPFVIVGLLFIFSHFLHRPRTLAAQARGLNARSRKKGLA
jgi:hypothetical protein